MGFILTTNKSKIEENESAYRITLLNKELRNIDIWQRTFDRIDFEDKTHLNEEVYRTIVNSETFRNFITNEIMSGLYKWSIPRKVEIAKAGTNKKRVVYMHDDMDRFFLGVLYRAMSEVFKDRIPENCFSYQRGVSVGKAVTYVKNTIQREDKYGVKMDISAYFNSVSKGYLESTLDTLFATGTGIRSTLDTLFLEDDVVIKGKVEKEYMGLIPGCALGAFFANYCLRDLDTDFLAMEGVTYARYSDDILVLADTREEIDSSIELIKAKLVELGLIINSKKYMYFEPKEEIDFLGLSISGSKVDITNHNKNKVKRKIKRWVKKARRDIEMNNRNFNSVARAVIKRINWFVYKSYVFDPKKYGWGYYVFQNINTIESLREIDFYLRDQLRYLKTGKHNKANVNALTDIDFKYLGVLSLVDMYIEFKQDKDYYIERAYLI